MDIIFADTNLCRATQKYSEQIETGNLKMMRETSSNCHPENIVQHEHAIYVYH